MTNQTLLDTKYRIISEQEFTDDGMWAYESYPDYIGRMQDIRAAYLAGAENNGLQWVKASREQLPEKDLKVFVKLWYTEYPKQLYVEHWDAEHILSVVKQDKYDIFYLDESLPCIKCKEREKEVEGLKKENDVLRKQIIDADKRLNGYLTALKQTK